jgi:hypothetical protein
MQSTHVKAGILACSLLMAAAALAQQTEHGGKPITIKMTGAASAGPRFHQWHGHLGAAFQSGPTAGLLRAEGQRYRHATFGNPPTTA